MSAKPPIELKLLTPEGGSESVLCDAVNFTARDNEAGEGGGSVGVRPGHIEAVAALEPGSCVRARVEGREVCAFTVPGGFAMVKNNTVTILSSGPAETKKRTESR